MTLPWRTNIALLALAMLPACERVVPVDLGTRVQDDDCRPADGADCPDTGENQTSFSLFGQAGTRFWLDVSEVQQQAMNIRLPVDPEGNDLLEEPRFSTDVYTLPDDGQPTPEGVDDGAITFADHLVVEAPGLVAADFGRVEVRLTGTSTRRPLVTDGIPNLRFDMDEFQDDLRIGGIEHFRLNNGVTGGMFREHVAAEVHRALGYPALRTTYAFLGSTVHGRDVWIPMILSETYKQDFCDENVTGLGGHCASLWKFNGDLGCSSTGWTPCANDIRCEAGECDPSALTAFGDAIRAAPAGEGLTDALDPYLDWEMYYRFQCLGLVTGTVDDALRNAGNNTVLAQRAEDGRFVFLPFSLDISAVDSALRGNIQLSMKCQADPTCWSRSRDACRAIVDELRTLGAEQRVDAALATLTDLAMMRPGDDVRAAELREWYRRRAAVVEAQLRSE
jgi:hypothetical protein